MVTRIEMIMLCGSPDYSQAGHVAVTWCLYNCKDALGSYSLQLRRMYSEQAQFFSNKVKESMLYQSFFWCNDVT